MVSRVWLCLLCLACVAVLTGCGGSDRPQVVAVSGVVTFDGAPLADAKVNFMAAGASQAATGTTDSEGKFQLTTYKENDGAVIGKHIVTITKVESGGGEGMDASNPDAAYAAAMSGAAQPESEIPAKYGDPAQSGLDANVTADGPNDKFTFALMP